MSSRAASSSSASASRASAPASCLLLTDLWRHLRQEHLFVQSERRRLSELNNDVRHAVERVAHAAHVARGLRQNLGHLGGGEEGHHEGGESLAALTCQKANLIDRTEFVDAYKHFQYQEVRKITQKNCKFY